MYKRPWLPQRHPPHYPTETRRDEGGIFGPILPIIPYDNLESAIDEVNNGKRPLGLYVYSKSLEEVNKIINDTNSGGTANPKPTSPTSTCGGPQVVHQLPSVLRTRIQVFRYHVCSATACVFDGVDWAVGLDVGTVTCAVEAEEWIESPEMLRRSVKEIASGHGALVVGDGLLESRCP
jgi:hypothetical protein